MPYTSAFLIVEYSILLNKHSLKRLIIGQISFIAWKYIEYVLFVIIGNQDKYYSHLAQPLMFMICDLFPEYDTNLTLLLNIPYYYLHSTGHVFRERFSTGTLTAIFAILPFT